LVNNYNNFAGIDFTRRKELLEKKITPTTFTTNNTTIGIIQNDWLKWKNEISNAYIHAIRNAKEEVTIVGSYFLSGRKLRKALKKASQEGIKIKLILAGISDVPFIKPALSYLYSYFLKQNIELYEWNKSILHGKAAVVDQQWTTIGSFNLNHLSSYGSIEMNVKIDSPEFSKELSTHLEDIISQCEPVTSDTLKKKKWTIH
jgi:cardiolipin synthase